MSPGEVLRQKRATLGNTTVGGALPGAGAPGRSRLGRMGGGARGALKFGAPLAVGLGAWSAYQVAGDDDLSAAQRRDAYGRIAGGAGGGVVGAGLGGAIGALFGGFGAVPGAMIGGALGNVIGEKIAEWMQRDKSVMDGYTPPPIVVQTSINLSGEQIAAAVNEVNARGGRRH